jgi:hypothetical protein
MIHEILLKMTMFLFVADFLLHGEECRKFSSTSLTWAGGLWKSNG